MSDRLEPLERFREQLRSHGRDHGIILLLNNLENRLLSDPGDYATALREAWSVTDHCSFFFHQWAWFWERAQPELVMTDSETLQLQAMSDEITLYRGYCAEDGTEYGLAWTPERNLAEHFSTHRTSSPAIAEMSGHKDELIHCLIKSRDGWEAISLASIL